MKVRWIGLVVLVAITVGPAGAVDIETVPVGNVGNAGEWSGESYGGQGPDRICGAVDYEYRIGKYEVTAGQYIVFLNAVAKTDTYGLYNQDMWSNSYGCGIQQSGSSGDYRYSVTWDYANRPVNYVSWGDAARFANWLSNGQPTGTQGPLTTENGSYYLNGAVTITPLLAVTRIADQDRIPGNKYWFVPTEDESYKAAYHKNDGMTGNYWDYPTSTDSVPSNDVVDPDSGNNANFNDSGFTIGSPYYRTPAGEFENSDSPYGTFDQAGNVWEWNEALVYGFYRGVRGGAFDNNGDEALLAGSRAGYNDPADEREVIGFRVSQIPEPAALSLLALGGIVLIRRARGAGRRGKGGSQ